MAKTYAPLFIVEIDGKELGKNISEKIERLSYEDSEKEMDMLKLAIVDADLSFIDHPQLQEGKEVRARWGYVGNMSEARTFTIKQISYTFGEDRLARIDLSAYDKRHKLTGRSARTCWKSKKVADVVKDIAGKHNFKPIVEVPEDAPREFISQGGKSDMMFLTELARDMGCSLWVTNDELHFEPNRLNAPVRKFCWGKDKDGYLQSFRITSNAERGKGTRGGTEISGLNPMTKKPIKETVAAKSDGKGGTIAIDLNKVATVGGGKGTHNENAQVNETPLQTKADEAGSVKPTPAPTQGQARREGKGKVQTSSMSSIDVTATTIGLPYLKAKDTITIEGIGKKFSGNWRIIKVIHKISKDDYTCDLTLRKSENESWNRKSGDAPKTVANNVGAAKDAGASSGQNKKSGVKRIDLNTGQEVQ